MYQDANIKYGGSTLRTATEENDHHLGSERASLPCWQQNYFCTLSCHQCCGTQRQSEVYLCQICLGSPSHSELVCPMVLAIYLYKPFDPSDDASLAQSDGADYDVGRLCNLLLTRK